MRLQITITITVALSVLFGYDLTGQTRSPEAQLKAAQHKEHVEGDLKGAIEQYKQLITRRDIARGITAEALLGLAQSYEKLGAAEARAVYEQIIRDYTDQGAIVAAARERVSVLGAPARGLVARQLLELPSSIAVLRLMSDGRIGATEWSTGDLVLVDPASGAISHVVQGDINKTLGAWAEDPLLSPDRRQLAYQWFDDSKDQGGALRLLGMERGAEPRTLVADPATVRNIYPIAWSKDATGILVCYEKPVPPGSISPAGRGDFALAWVTVEGGAIKPIKTFEWWRSGVGSLNSIGTVSLSPDGVWIAYAVPDHQGAPDRSIFVMRADGSGERRVMSGGVNDQPIWSPDGSRLVFLSNRSGDPALWSVAVNERGANTPTLVKSGMGRVLLHGMLASGVLVYSESGGADPLIVAELDQPLASNRTSALRTLETLNGLVPAWSPDGRFLAYKRRTTNATRPIEIVVRTSETGELRAYSPQTGSMGPGRPTWHLDGTVQAITRSGVRLRVGTSLEEVAVPATLPMGYVSPDGRTLYAAAGDGIEIFDVSSGTRTGSISLPKTWRPAALSPDGRTLALVSFDNDPAVKLAVIGVDGSGFRQLSPSFSGGSRGSVIWTRDGTALLVGVSTGKDVFSIQRVPITGGPPVTVADNIVGLRSFDVTADERRIAYSTDHRSTDVWVLDLKAALK